MCGDVHLLSQLLQSLLQLATAALGLPPPACYCCCCVGFLLLLRVSTIREVDVLRVHANHVGRLVSVQSWHIL